ncbi:MAG: ATP-binding protein [Lachnospiraceae bacterium]|nr:ATP-binding protein [Lachnospiraceae bacterium]
MGLKREMYLTQIRPYYETDLIKVITGVRRAGKSILLDTIREEFLEKGVGGDHLIYLNLEDMDFEYIVTASDLNQEIKNRIVDQGKYYIFLDEIQHVQNFEKALASFRATLNVSLFVTGSNSTLLSGELATLLIGRTVEFEIMPFSFLEMKEYLELNNRDIVKKGRSMDRKTFLDLSRYILANAGREFSTDSIISYYRQHNGKEISRRTVYNYLDKMKKAYLVHGVGRYYISGRTSLKNRKKYYAVDMGFCTIHTNTVSFDETFFLENIVYNELLVQGYQVFTGKTYKGEVDFVAIKEGKKCFIQVSYLLAGKETIEREFGAYKPITDASPKYILSLDKVDMSRNGIAHMNLVDFLLHRKKLALT